MKPLVQQGDHEVRKLLEKAVETMQLGVTVTDAGGTIVYTNPAEARMHGYSLEELLGRDARLLSPREHWKQMTPEELRDVRQWPRERQELRKDGSAFPVRLLSDVVKEADGAPIGIVTTCEDITERKLAEDALRQSEERYRSLVEAARDVITTLSPDGTITSLNPAFEVLTGWPTAEWVGRCFTALIHPDDVSTVMAVMQRVIHGETPQASEARILTRPGYWRVVEYTANPQVRGGKTIGVLTIARDITGRKQTQQRQATLYVVSRVLGEATTLSESTKRLLQAVCVGLGWDVGLLWTVDPREKCLRCAGLWHMPELDVAAFAAASMSALFAAGEEAPGVVWQTGSRTWTADLGLGPRNGRETEAARAGLHAACLVPVASEGQVIAVLELLSLEAREADDDVAAALADVAGEIGESVRRMRIQERLRESEERYALAVRGANDGIWDWDLAAGQVYFSARWKSMLGYEEDEVGSGPEEWFARVHPEDRERVKDRVAAHLEGRAPHFEDEHRMRGKDGGYRWVLSRGFAVRNEQGKPHRMAGAQTDITDRRTYDALTGLANRALFLERLTQALSRSRRRRGFLFGVLFVDLDRFKVVNDSLGHLAGDELLISVARRLESCLRPGDVVGRFGGDEFAILLESIREVGDATHVADRIQGELGTPLTIAGQEVFTSASIGIALSATGYQRAADLLRDADTAMYRAKARGRACYEVFDEAMRARVMAQLELENDLRRALERQEFCLRYEPIVALESGRIEGFEALLRWRHPRRGIIPPSEFIPVAEETGLILPIGDWVIREACQQLQTWRAQLPGRPLRMSVNLSGRQFGDPGLANRIKQVLEETGLDAGSLRLEITEGVILENSKPVAALISELKALGVRLDIDDFGTGYSSLSYLHRFPVDSLKVDRSFVGKLNGNGESAAIVRAILALARSMHLEVVAEGVETSAQLEALRALHCPHVQGHYLSQPLDPKGAWALLSGRGASKASPGRRASARSKRVNGNGNGHDARA